MNSTTIYYNAFQVLDNESDKCMKNVKNRKSYFLIIVLVLNLLINIFAVKSYYASETKNIDEEKDFVIVTSTAFFHFTDCYHLDRAHEENKKYTSSTIRKLIDSGYMPCEDCIGYVAYNPQSTTHRINEDNNSTGKRNYSNNKSSNGQNYDYEYSKKGHRVLKVMLLPTIIVIILLIIFLLFEFLRIKKLSSRESVIPYFRSKQRKYASTYYNTILKKNLETIRKEQFEIEKSIYENAFKNVPLNDLIPFPSGISYNDRARALLDSYSDELYGRYTLYVSNNGKCYHCKKGCHNATIPINTIENIDALRLYYTPCSVCNIVEKTYIIRSTPMCIVDYKEILKIKNKYDIEDDKWK